MSAAARLVLLALLALLAAHSTAGCSPDADPDPDAAPPTAAPALDLPAHFPALPVPEDNPLSAEKVALGRHLFYDPRLSADGDVSCASCHQQALAFSDGRAHAIGSRGTVHRRSSPSLANVGHARRLTWANPLLARLEHQAMVPIFGEEPVEMGGSGEERAILERLRGDPAYAARFAAAFPADADPVSVRNLVRALASFERTLVSDRSAYDRYLAGDAEALDAAQRRGLALFESPRLACSRCHGGVLLDTFQGPDPTPTRLLGYHHTGLYDVDGAGGYPAHDRGLVEVTGDPDDEGRFRAPSLRNIALTAPYMHDGSLPTLDAVLDHYAGGGRAPSPRVSDLLGGFELSAAERADLLAFFESLTDHSFVTDPSLSSPFANAP